MSSQYEDYLYEDKSFLANTENHIDYLEMEYNYLVALLSDSHSSTKDILINREKAKILKRILESFYDSVLQNMTNDEIRGLIPQDYVMGLFHEEYVDSFELFLVRAEKMLKERKKVSYAFRKKYGFKTKPVIN